MKIRYIISISLLFLAFGLFQLLGNQGFSTELAKQIILKDKAAQDVQVDITNLQNYVHSHMRASVKFQLVGSYSRALDQAEAAQPHVNGDIASRAQAACAGRADSAVQATCVRKFVAANSQPGANLTPAQLPDKSKYEYNLTSPAWAPDLPGLFLLAGVAGLALAAWFTITRHLFKL